MDPREDNEAEEVVKVERLSGGVEIAVNFEVEGGGNNDGNVMEVRAGQGFDEAALLEDFDVVVVVVEARRRGLGLWGGVVATIGVGF